jgi:two-component system chemotaxis response regulator CheV
MPAAPDRQNLLASVDARANLAGTNKMELLLFRIGSPETYGINVFKVKEVIRTVDITAAPGQPPFVIGMASLRGQLIPVIDLISLCGNPAPDHPGILIITEFSHSTQAFLVEAVDTIIRIDWSDVHQPPDMLASGTKITGVTRLADGTLVAIMDVEQILHTISGTPPLQLQLANTSPQALAPGRKLFFVDDSAFARNQLKQILDQIGVQSDFAVNGQKAWAQLDAMAKAAEAIGRRLEETLPIIITDIEMPEMDGFKLTRMIKADRRFDGIKVLLHSSMSESSNRDKGLALGADGFLAKYDQKAVAESLQTLLAEIADKG